MSEEIIIAIIGAGGVVLAAIIGGIFSFLKRNKDNGSILKIKQSQKGNNNIQIGQQNNNGDIKNG